MELKSVEIKNYRSIESIAFNICSLEDKTFTYGLIGVNEAGKSSVLKAMALKDGLRNEKGEQLPLKKDFTDPKKPIEIEYDYVLSKEDVQECREFLLTQDPVLEVTSIDFTRIKLFIRFDFASPSQLQYLIDILGIEAGDGLKIAIQDKLKKNIFDKSHKSIFWTAEDRYLISQPISLTQFAGSPHDVSVPLKNCFFLAGILNIAERINILSGDSTEVELLQTELGTKVTQHINAVWPKHPVEITFLITDGLIHFHVKDLGDKGKAKTADQRSDGFKQFVSFLLTVSAQNKNEELSNSILLLDEPETHLHPQAQEDLLRELIKITQNNRNNIVFFATHSNYMIDKDDLSRNYKIRKNKDKTQKEQFDKKASTYASVSYEVFDIASTDYHNELYSKLHERYQELDMDDKERAYILNFDANFFKPKSELKADKPWKEKTNQVTLPTFVRNCIHHPEGYHKYKPEELRKSTEILRSYL